MKNLIATTVVCLLISTPGFAQSETDQEMRSLTSNILAGITGTPAVPEAATETSTPAIGNLQILVEQALSEGQSDAYLEALIGEAADKGEIEVPDAMRTTDGAPDTRTLLASIVAKSEAGEAASVVAQLDREATGEKADQIYQVVAGDSLAAISLRFYGTSQDYGRIFDANRDTLRSPDRISIGQSLRIPS